MATLSNRGQRETGHREGKVVAKSQPSFPCWNKNGCAVIWADATFTAERKEAGSASPTTQAPGLLGNMPWSQAGSELWFLYFPVV